MSGTTAGGAAGTVAGAAARAVAGGTAAGTAAGGGRGSASRFVSGAEDTLGRVRVDVGLGSAASAAVEGAGCTGFWSSSAAAFEDICCTGVVLRSDLRGRPRFLGVLAGAVLVAVEGREEVLFEDGARSLRVGFSTTFGSGGRVSAAAGASSSESSWTSSDESALLRGRPRPRRGGWVGVD